MVALAALEFTQYVNQTVLKFRDPSASIFRVLESRVLRALVVLPEDYGLAPSMVS